jgi:hypothetical protein
MAMNLLRAGELPAYFADGKHADGEDLEDFDVEACVRAIEAGGDRVWGVDLYGHSWLPQPHQQGLTQGCCGLQKRWAQSW